MVTPIYIFSLSSWTVIWNKLRCRLLQSGWEAPPTSFYCLCFSQTAKAKANSILKEKTNKIVITVFAIDNKKVQFEFRFHWGLFWSNLLDYFSFLVISGSDETENATIVRLLTRIRLAFRHCFSLSCHFPSLRRFERSRAKRSRRSYLFAKRFHFVDRLLALPCPASSGFQSILVSRSWIRAFLLPNCNEKTNKYIGEKKPQF